MPEREVVFLRRAEERLSELAIYIANEAGPVTAERYLDRIYALCSSLSSFPGRGRMRNDILPGLRVVTMERRLTVAYRMKRRTVEIVTIAYAGRDFIRELKGSGG